MDDTAFAAATVWHELMQVLAEKWRSPLFAAKYNNTSPYRSRNCRPRTDAMLKDSDSVLVETLQRIKVRAGIGDEGELSRDRYVDLSFATGDWWIGAKRYHLAIEVENNWRELHGTLLDLYRFQARTKVAIFYNSADEAMTWLIDAAAEVARSFREQGLQESGETSYLLVLLPEGHSTLISSEARALEFTGLDGVRVGLERKGSLSCNIEDAESVVARKP